LFLGPLRDILVWRTKRVLNGESLMTYPRGLPESPDLFRLEDVVSGVIQLLGEIRGPTLAYLHLFPPHGEYRPKGKFNHSFEDSLVFPRSPIHPLVENAAAYDGQENQRRRYDQYLASWDSELARLFAYLEESGLLETSYIFLTSDHGELFQRGAVGHFTPLIYEPLVHVPLIVSVPGQTSKIDVDAVTSSVDLLSTVAYLTMGEVPAWAEGKLLPGLGGVRDENRSIFSMDAKTNSAFRRLEHVSMSLMKNEYRLTYYKYPEQDYEAFELYNLSEDRQELTDIYAAQPAAAGPLREELLSKLSEINRGFDK
jgi:arylsulfatase A-like enzyme